MGQNEVAARMIWLLLCRFHNGYENWDEVREAVEMMFFVALSWLLQKAVGKFVFSRGSGVARLSKNALMHGLVQYKEETYATPKFVVDRLPWHGFVEKAVRVMNDTIHAARFGRISTMCRGQCETLHSANNRRVQRLIRDYTPYNVATSSQSVRILAMNDVDEQMPALVSSGSSTSSCSEAVFEEF
jgi:hypothetical protein